MAPPVAYAIGAAVLALGRLAAKQVGKYLVKRGIRKAAERVMKQALENGKKKLDDLLKKCGGCKPTRALCKKLFGQGSKPPMPGVYRGGAYSELGTAKFKTEAHHIPASGVGYPRADGPAIQMDYEDHKTGTASWGSSNDAKGYRESQKNLAGQAGFYAAMAMDILDIKNSFGDKYDAAIAEAVGYAGCLEAADAAAKGSK